MKLKVAHRDVEVIPMDPASCHDAVGLWWDHAGTIVISPDRPPEDQARILIHELLHAIHSCFRLDSRERDEEGICGDFDAPLATVLRDNPSLLAVLHQALNQRKPIVTAKRRH